MSEMSKITDMSKVAVNVKSNRYVPKTTKFIYLFLQDSASFYSVLTRSNLNKTDNGGATIQN